MRNTTLCYIERGQQYLMLHRVKKENDLNHDKWVGIGGKFEGNETPDECLLREAYEETGLTLTDWRCRGVVTFLSDTWEGEYMYLFTAGGFTGTLRECNEGVLSWVDKAAVPALPRCTAGCIRPSSRRRSKRRSSPSTPASMRCRRPWTLWPRPRALRPTRRIRAKSTAADGTQKSSVSDRKRSFFIWFLSFRPAIR